ncbi:hypothetical protein DCC85_05955 [Paenibacillus sp. CAA11]|uniref:hypothetical protein n=1 Tax=Paenibacillus sp. CAA11 TaxID=1532905 RepID=UPI000D3C7231|nr:hypothetical protein [Paenibacillus sp. CAA11]AWB43812.1 hypothetical protein DCC85_05955 [Paenibacillus sp. CAA11]
MINLKAVKLDLKSIFRNYLFIAGAIIISYVTYTHVANYVDYAPNLSAERFNSLYQKDGVSDIPGVPTKNSLLNVPLKNEKERIFYAKKDLISRLTELAKQKEATPEEVTQEDLQLIKNELKDDTLGVNEINAIVEKYIGIPGYFDFYYMNTQNANKGYEAYNQYASGKVAEKGFPFYFGMKYHEFLLLYIVFFLIVFIPIHLFFFVKKENIEILRYRVIGFFSPLTEKVLSLLIALTTILVLNNLFYTCIFLIKGLGGFSEILLFWLNSLIILAPICFVCSASLFICILCRNSIVIFPILVGSILYSNYPKFYDDGTVRWVVRPLSILIRYTESFWENSAPDNLYLHSAALVVISVIFIFVGNLIIRRRSNVF